MIGALDTDLNVPGSSSRQGLPQKCSRSRKFVILFECCHSVAAVIVLGPGGGGGGCITSVVCSIAL